MNQKLTAGIAAVFILGAVIALLSLVGSSEGEPDPIVTRNNTGNSGNTGRPRVSPDPEVEVPPTPQPGEKPPVEATPTPKIDSNPQVAYTDEERRALSAIESVLKEIEQLRLAPMARGPEYFDQMRALQARIDELVKSLVNLGDAAIRPLLDTLVKGGSEREALMKALVGIGGEKVRDGILAAYMGTEDYKFQTEMLKGLSQWKGELGAFYAEAYEGAKDFRVQMAILRQMSERGESTAGAMLAQALSTSKDPNVRIEALRSMKKVRDPMAYPQIEAVILATTEDLAIRQNAIYAAAATDQLRAQSTLQTLASENTELGIQASAIHALGEYYGEEAIPFLQSLASTSTNPEIQRRATRAVEIIQRRADPSNAPEFVPPETRDDRIKIP